MPENTAPGRAPGFAKRPDYKLLFEPTEKRVRVQLGGQTVADSTATLLVLEQGHTPVYYFPRDDVRMDLLTPTDRSTHCPYKGDARYWTVAAGGRTAEDAVWSYEAPFDETKAIAGYMAFYWDRMDRWLEEDEEVFVHPRDPHVRIDIRGSSRPVRVELDGTLLAETKRARVLFETGQPARWYIPPEDVHTELLVNSDDTHTACPYKGTARHLSARIKGAVTKDVAWTYAMPTPEARRVADYVCFYPEKVTLSVSRGKD